MVSIKGVVAFLVGTAAMLGGAAMAFQTMGTPTLSLGWGVLAFLGVFPFVYGTTSLLFGGSGHGRDERGTPPGKT